MNYEDFKEELQEELQANFLQHIDFSTAVVKKVNETLEGLTLRFENQNKIAPTIYPERLYEEYKNGTSVEEIVDNISESLFITGDYPELPSLTAENAEKCISFSLINKEKNKELIAECPHKEVYDMVAVPRWYISDEASFIVDNNIMQMLHMTKEEILEVAQRNTELGNYTCKNINEVMKEIMVSDGIEEEFINEVLPMGQVPFYVLSNEKGIDGSCAVLSDSFMQRVSDKLGNDGIFLLPSSRHEMIAVGFDNAIHLEDLKEIVGAVNNDPLLMQKQDYLSGSIYQYNAKTHTLSICDSMGMFHNKECQKESMKQSIGRGRIGI